MENKKNSLEFFTLGQSAERVRETLLSHLQDPENDLKKAEFNKTQTDYKDKYGVWYRPEIKLNGKHYI